MRVFQGVFLVCVFFSGVAAQADIEPMFSAERAFLSAAEREGLRSAFLDVLAPDSLTFTGSSVNALEHWRAQPVSGVERVLRVPLLGDLSHNGQLGYTTGSWKAFPDGNGKDATAFGEYLTIWEKRNGKYFAALDMTIEHDEAAHPRSRSIRRSRTKPQENKRGWSPADASMTFLKTSMTGGLSLAYERYAADDVRLLMERHGPIEGRKDVIEATSIYRSVDFPVKTWLLQSDDLAYTWNPCEYANSDEGTEKGNCVQVWKLRDKRWYIVLGMFSRLKDPRLPKLKVPAAK